MGFHGQYHRRVGYDHDLEVEGGEDQRVDVTCVYSILSFELFYSRQLNRGHHTEQGFIHQDSIFVRNPSDVVFKVLPRLSCNDESLPVVRSRDYCLENVAVDSVHDCDVLVFSEILR